MWTGEEGSSQEASMQQAAETAGTTTSITNSFSGAFSNDQVQQILQNIQAQGGMMNVQQGPQVATGNLDKNFEKGDAATAKIVSLAETDKKKQGQTVYAIQYFISPKKGKTYTLDKEVPFPDYVVQLIKVGASYPCEINPKDHTNIKVNLGMQMSVKTTTTTKTAQ